MLNITNIFLGSLKCDYALAKFKIEEDRAEFKVHDFIRKIGLRHLAVQYKTIHLQTANTLVSKNKQKHIVDP